MIVPANNSFAESTSTHSLGLQNNMTIPNPGFDTNPLMVNEKRFWGGGVSGLDTLFQSGLDFTLWEAQDWIVAGIGLLGVWWLVTPGGNEYVIEKKRLRSKHRGYKRVSRWLEPDSGGNSGGSKKAKSKEIWDS